MEGQEYLESLRACFREKTDSRLPHNDENQGFLHRAQKDNIAISALSYSYMDVIWVRVRIDIELSLRASL